MIKPTVGRIVWFWEAGENLAGYQPRAAIIAYVHSDRLINVAVFDRDGCPIRALTEVQLLQGDDMPPELQRFCEWMPYQVGQAKAAEAVPPINRVVSEATCANCGQPGHWEQSCPTPFTPGDPAPSAPHAVTPSNI